jgi:predicted ribosome quality control (RQC) complex YloA/Tae2 family protein
MHNSYFFLKHLSHELNQKLQGYSVVSCFSQSKDELIIEFNNNSSSFFIKAHLQSDFCCLSFPSAFSRARKNSVDLFQEVVLKRVETVRQFDNERSFLIELTDGLGLLFKMYGNRSNIILFQDGVVLGIFRNHLVADLEIQLNTLDRSLDWNFDYFKKNEFDIRKAFFTISNDSWEYLESQGWETLDIEMKWNLLHKFRNQLMKGEFFLIRKDGRISLSLFETDEVIRKHLNSIDALNDFFLLKMQTGSMDDEKQSALRIILEKEKQTARYIAKNKALLHSLETDQQYQLWADLIMANLHLVGKGMEKVSLDNYHAPGQSVEIKLKKDLTPLKNAEAYYRKAKNQQVEITKLSEGIQQKEKTLAELQKMKAALANTEDGAVVKKLLKRSGIKSESEKESIRLPYKEVEFKSFVIRIGKNADDNDELTLKYSYKEDLWLHAKDVSGSHVVIKHQAGKNFPKDVIERAAELAAFHSKRKGESLCPVAVTSKKFVRKRKGDPAGMVVVEKEKVIMVEPKQ